MPLLKTIISWGFMACRVEKHTDISKGYIASIFKVEEYAKQATGKMQAEIYRKYILLKCWWASIRLYDITPQKILLSHSLL
jgi:hypothetical protein